MSEDLTKSKIQPKNSMFNKIRSGIRVARVHGIRNAIEHARFRSFPWVNKRSIASLVRLEDVVQLDWTSPKQWQCPPEQQSKSSFHVAWIVSPPGANSGGHQNLFRFIDFLETAGHRCTVYLYDSAGNLPTAESVAILLSGSDAYPDVKAKILHYDGSVDEDVDAIFATGWETAYPSFNDVSTAKRFYFIQDYEPLFYALGTDSVLAENTYRFGFHGITAGGWLAKKVTDEFGMSADHFDFAVDPEMYNVTNAGDRDEVFFYARPSTPRRAFEFGVLVLAELKRRRPQTIINFAGEDVSDWNIPFEYNNLGAKKLQDLNEIYNRCRVALVMSLSNMSLLPLELIAAGVRPIVNDGANNRLVSDNPDIAYAPMVPERMAERLQQILDSDLDAVELQRMSDSVSSFTWQDSGKQFLNAFERRMRD